MEMSELEVLEQIKTGKKLAVKVWMENCPKCDEFKPVFEKVAAEQIGALADQFVSFLLPPVTSGSSVFKKEYMKVKVGEKMGAPAVLVFENGEMKFRHFGKMDEASLINFIGKGEAPVDQKNLARQELMLLFARRGELSMLLEELPQLDSKIREIQKFLGAP